MTMGTRLACMAAGDYPSRIVPALLFTGNVLGLERRHGSCATRGVGDDASERALANELGMERGMRFRTAIQSPQALRGVALPRRHRLDLGIDLPFGHRDPQPHRH